MQIKAVSTSSGERIYQTIGELIDEIKEWSENTEGQLDVTVSDNYVVIEFVHYESSDSDSTTVIHRSMLYLEEITQILEQE